MWFHKKQKASVKRPSDARAQYRKRPPKSVGLEATLRVSGWEPVKVELIDLSIRGAGIRVPFKSDRNLRIGDTVELTIGALMRSDVRTAARVVFAQADGESHVRYGLQFLNLGGLYSQLDTLYARVFNRRKHRRVMPTLDRRTHVMLTWNGGEIRAQMFDLSTHGIGVTLTRDGAARVAHISRFDLRFSLPGAAEVIGGPAEVRHRSAHKSQVLIGLAFDMEHTPGLAQHAEAIEAYVERREAEISRWEEQWS
jgi:c-di-GMP-binding flagellar brake protein YcgR